MYLINSKVYIAVESEGAVFIERHTIKQIELYKQGPDYLLSNGNTYKHGELFRTKSKAIESRVSFHKNMIAYYEALIKEAKEFL